MTTSIMAGLGEEGLLDLELFSVPFAGISVRQKLKA